MVAGSKVVDAWQIIQYILGTRDPISLQYRLFNILFYKSDSKKNINIPNKGIILNEVEREAEEEQHQRLGINVSLHVMHFFY